MRAFTKIGALSALLLVAASCRNGTPQSQPPKATPSEAAPVTNRIDIPDAVRRNLGLTFAKVETRPVAATIRVPGRFELLPDARREYRTMLAGRIELLANQFQKVERGAVLYRLDSPALRELQQNLAQAEAQVREYEKRMDMTGPMVEAHNRRRQAVEQTVDLLAARTERLAKGEIEGSVSAENVGQVQAMLAEAHANLAEVLEKGTELAVRRVEISSQLEAARVRFELLVNSASTLLGLDPEQILSPDNSSPSALPKWRTLKNVEVLATAPGFVESLAATSGAWLDSTSLVLTIVQPDRLRFHAHAMQSDLGKLRDDLEVRIVPPRSETVALNAAMDGRLKVSFIADSEQRTVDLYVVPAQLQNWARAGVAGHLEIMFAGGVPELAIPVSAVIQDGLSSVLFRRDPANPDKVIRIADADLGVSDGRWVVIHSGVKEGDEVVLDGLYQLMVATSGSIQKGGHFHADGTFHEGNE